MGAATTDWLRWMNVTQKCSRVIDVHIHPYNVTEERVRKEYPDQVNCLQESLESPSEGDLTRAANLMARKIAWRHTGMIQFYIVTGDGIASYQIQPSSIPALINFAIAEDPDTLELQLFEEIAKQAHERRGQSYDICMERGTFSHGLQQVHRVRTPFMWKYTPIEDLTSSHP